MVVGVQTYHAAYIQALCMNANNHAQKNIAHANDGGGMAPGPLDPLLFLARQYATAVYRVMTDVLSDYLLLGIRDSTWGLFRFGRT